jgi:hypothetical protein
MVLSPSNPPHRNAFPIAVGGPPIWDRHTAGPARSRALEDALRALGIVVWPIT